LSHVLLVLDRMDLASEGLEWEAEEDRVRYRLKMGNYSKILTHIKSN